MRAKRLPVRSETYTEIVFVEPFEPFYDILTGGGPARGGKGKAKNKKKEEEKRTAEVPMTSTTNNPFSRQTEELELEKLAVAQKKVQEMIQAQGKINTEREKELARLRAELDLPPKK